MQSERGNESTGRVRVERGIYRQTNGTYAVCVMIDGRPSLRTVAGDLEQARVERELLREAARNGLLTLWPRLTFGAVASQWLARFERRVATGERRERTLENYRYYLDHHLLPEVGRKRIRSLTPADMASLAATLTTKGLAPKTVANALVPLGGILRFARRRGYILDDPLRRLEKAERPRPTPRTQRVLGQTEIAELLRACLPRYRPLLATGLYTGMRLSDLLALTWAEVDFEVRAVRVRAQLSRAHVGAPARQVAAKTRAAVREIPLAPQLATVLARERRRTRFSGANRLRLRNTAGHTARATKRRPHRPRPRGQAQPPRRTRPTAASLPRPPPHLRQPPHRRPAPRRLPSQPHPRPRTHRDHPRRLHPSLRSGAPRRRHPRRHGREPLRPDPRRSHRDRTLAQGRRQNARADRSGWASATPDCPPRASVARRVNVEVLDHSLTNVLCPGRAARPLRNRADFQRFRWS
jgi:integrase